MITKALTLLSFTIAVLYSCLANADENETDSAAVPPSPNIITLRADEWFPYNGQPDSDKPGYMIEIARYAFAKHGYQLDYQLMPWERSLEEAHQGNIDCVVGAAKSEAPDFIYHKQALGIDRMGFFGLADKEAFNYQDISSINSRTLGVIGGYGYTQEIDQYIKQHQNGTLVHVAKGNDALNRNIKMLLSGRIDLLLETPPVLEYKLSTMGLEGKIKRLAQTQQTNELYIACNPDNPKSVEYMQYIDNALTELRETGKLKTFLKPYGLSDWQDRSTSNNKH